MLFNKISNKINDYVLKDMDIDLHLIDPKFDTVKHTVFSLVKRVNGIWFLLVCDRYPARAKLVE